MAPTDRQAHNPDPINQPTHPMLRWIEAFKGGVSRTQSEDT